MSIQGVVDIDSKADVELKKADVVADKDVEINANPLKGDHKDTAGGVTSEEPVRTEPVFLADAKSKSILAAYYHGQLAQTTTFGIWWCLSSPIFIALLGHNGVGQVRIVYNAAICITSPIAGGFAELGNVRTLLLVTSWIRLLTYGAFIPLLWFIFRSGWWGVDAGDADGAFKALFLTALFVDGANVAVLNVVAIDGGGPDLLSAQHKLELTDEMRGSFMSGHTVVMDVAMVVMAPLLATITLVLGDHVANDDDEIENLLLISALGGTVAVFNLYSVAQYTWHIPSAYPVEEGAPERPLMKTLFSAVCEGGKLVLQRPPIAWRLVFFALEIALEDTMVALVCPEYAILIISPNDTLRGNFWTNILIAVSKIGGVITGIAMNRCWVKMESKHYGFMFACCGVGGAAALCIPIAIQGFGVNADSDSSLWRDGIVFASAFVFFFFFTIPKIGFGALLQELVGESEHAGLIYGFVATVITITNSLVVFGFSLTFEHLSLETAFWITCSGFTLVGLVEALFGKTLFLPKDDDAKSQDSEAASGLSSIHNNIVETPSSPRLHFRPSNNGEMCSPRSQT